MNKKILFLLSSILFLGTISVFAGNVFVSENGIQAAYISEDGNTGLTQTFVCMDGNGGNRTLIFENGLLVNATEGSSSNSSNSSNTISNHATLNNGLILYYDLDESSGSTVGDSSASNDGTYNGALQGQNSLSSGDVGTAFGFDGTDDKINTSIDLTDYSSYSVSVWVYLPITGQEDVFIGQDYPNDRVFALSYNDASDPGEKLLHYNGATLLYGDDLAQGAWTHLVVVENTTGSYLYKNATLQSSGTGYIPASSAKNMWIGGREYTGVNSFFQGRIDEVAVYSRGLTLDEISDLYNSGDGLAYD